MGVYWLASSLPLCQGKSFLDFGWWAVRADFMAWSFHSSRSIWREVGESE